MIYHSSSGRKVATFLQSVGIEPSLDDAYRIELAAFRFWPNHIIGVCEQVLKGSAAKLQRAQDQGWEYFDKPVWQILSKRGPAQRPGLVSPAPEKASALPCFKHVQTSLLIRDMDDKEVEMLFFSIPKLVPKREVLMQAIRSCIDRDVRNVHYLHGVLKRRKQEKEGATAKLRVGNEPWEPAADYEPLGPAERARLEVEWKRDADKTIAIMRNLREFKAQ